MTAVSTMRYLAGCLLLAVLAVTGGPARADTWMYDPVVTETRFVFGAVEIVRTRDARAKQTYPDHTIEIRRDGKPVALYRGVWFEDIFANAANNHFIGLSNSGHPGTAVIQFDNRGNLLRMWKHNSDFTPAYCRESVSTAREWYDEKNPEVTFEYDIESYGTYLRDIRVRLCDGTVASLSAVNRRSHQEWLDRTDRHEALVARLAVANAKRCAAAAKEGTKPSEECGRRTRHRSEAGKRGRAQPSKAPSTTRNGSKR